MKTTVIEKQIRTCVYSEKIDRCHVRIDLLKKQKNSDMNFFSFFATTVLAAVVVVTRPGRVIAAGSSAVTAANENNRILRNILLTKSWLYDENVENNLPLQKMFVGGKSTRLIDVLNGLPLISEGDFDKVSGAMYVALGCKCSEEIAALLKWAVGSPGTVTQLHRARGVITKCASALMDFTDVAPNVVSVTTDLLTTLLSLDTNGGGKYPFRDVDDGGDSADRTILRTINSVERFTILNCSVDDYLGNDGNGNGTGAVKKSSGKKKKGKTVQNYAVKKRMDVDDVLNDVGLSTDVFADQNIDTIFDRVIRELDCVLDVEEFLSIKTENTRTGDIFSDVRYVLDSIMRIVYEVTLTNIELFEKCQNDKNTELLASTRNEWIDKDLITIYEELIMRSDLLRFPTYFTGHIELVQRMVRDIMFLKNIHDLSIVKKQITEKLNALRNKEHTGLRLMSRNYEFQLDLWEFLKIILSVEEFKYVNLVVRLRPNDDVVVNVSPGIALDGMNFGNMSERTCETIWPLYASCFGILSKIEGCKSKKRCLQNLKEEYSRLLHLAKSAYMSSYRQNDSVDVILPMVKRYLNMNAIHYTDDEEKLNRIIYTVVNLIERLLIHGCYYPKYLPIVSANNLAEKRKHVGATGGGNINNIPKPPPPAKEHAFADDDTNGLFIKNVIEMLNGGGGGSAESTAFFYWKGELKTIDEATVDVTENVYDYFSYAKFVNLFHRWIASALFREMDDVLKHFLRKNYVRTDDRTFTAYVRKLPSVKFPENLTPVVNAFGNAPNFYYSANVIAFRILIEEHFKNQNGVARHRQRNPPASRGISVYTKRLDVIFDGLKTVYNTSPRIDLQHYDLNSSDLKSKDAKSNRKWFTK